MKFSPRLPAPARTLLALAAIACAASARAQTVFVCLGGKAKMASVITIPAPGHGWEFSAAAPVPGVHWNRIKRTAGVDATDPALAEGKASAIRLGVHPLDSAEDVALMDPAGNPTAARLGIRIEIRALATDKPRAEPAIHSKSKGAVPTELMESAWRVYLPDNSLIFTLNGLVPAQPYELYFYGSCVDPVSNPDGAGEGARFTLAQENVAPGGSGTVETKGGFGGGIYTFNPETNKMAPSPAGTTWAKLSAVADARGRIEFRTSRNSEGRHYVNGFQLVQIAR
jgi:hypothetical protein